MRGTKAKRLRGLAGVTGKETRIYEVLEHTKRNKIINNLAGEVTHRYSTGTYILSPSTRLLYKNLKKTA